eukprot:Pgem_evm2s18382
MLYQESNWSSLWSQSCSYGLSCNGEVNAVVVLDCGCINTSILLNNISLFDKSSLQPKTQVFKAADGGSIVVKQKGFAYLNGLKKNKLTRQWSCLINLLFSPKPKSSKLLMVDPYIAAKQKGFAYLNGLKVKAYYIPGLSVNLVGMAKIFKAGYKIDMTMDKAIVYGHGAREMFYCTNNLRKMKVKSNVAAFSSCNYSSIEV